MKMIFQDSGRNDSRFSIDELLIHRCDSYWDNIISNIVWYQGQYYI